MQKLNPKRSLRAPKWRDLGTILGPFWKHFLIKFKKEIYCLYFFNFVTILIDFYYFSTSKIIDFHATVLIFEVFAVSTRNVNFVMFLFHFEA